MNFLSSHNYVFIRTGKGLWYNVTGLAQLLISLNGVCLVSLMALFERYFSTLMVMGIIWML